MGADFCMAILPLCKLTAERLAVVMELIDKTDWQQVAENCGLDLDCLKSEAADALEQYPMDGRETSTLLIQGAQYVVTGGMSWGDAPTDTYDVICSLDRVPGLFDKFEAWSKEDQAAA